MRDEKVKVLGALRPMRAADVVRGQYAAGFSEGEPVPGYREEEGVAPDSRDRDVRRRARARRQLALGRRAVLPAHRQAAAEARHRDRDPLQARAATCRSRDAAAEQLEPNVLVLRIQPDEGISLRFVAKVPGDAHQIRTVNMDFDYGAAFVADRRGVRALLLDAMRGDATLFTRQDEVTESWRVVEPVLEAWQRQGGAPHLYAAGTWGPDAADDLIARDGRRWRRP